jgi:hypothetical protein
VTDAGIGLNNIQIGFANPTYTGTGLDPVTLLLMITGDEGHILFNQSFGTLANANSYFSDFIVPSILGSESDLTFTLSLTSATTNDSFGVEAILGGTTSVPEPSSFALISVISVGWILCFYIRAERQAVLCRKTHVVAPCAL